MGHSDSGSDCVCSVIARLQDAMVVSIISFRYVMFGGTVHWESCFFPFVMAGYYCVWFWYYLLHFCCVETGMFLFRGGGM